MLCATHAPTHSLQQHGASYSTFYRRTKSKTPTVLVVRTTENEVHAHVHKSVAWMDGRRSLLTYPFAVQYESET